MIHMVYIVYYKKLFSAMHHGKEEIQWKQRRSSATFVLWV